MKSINQFQITATLANDVEIQHHTNKTTGEPLVVGKFSLAINRKGEKTCYLQVTVFGKIAENASQYLRKGSKVSVLGVLKTESWEDKVTGEAKSRLVMTGLRTQYLDKQQPTVAIDQKVAPILKVPQAV
jgi:single-strand DNA-binding protein